MMVMALRYELGQPATEADQLRYRAVDAVRVRRKGCGAIEHWVLVSEGRQCAALVYPSCQPAFRKPSSM